MLFHLMLFGYIVVAGCGNDDFCVEREISRTPSPDKRVDAVILRSDCGATTSYSYRIQVVESGNELVESDTVFLADNVKRIELAWRAPKKLVITYDDARIFEFTNFWHSRNVDNFRYIISVDEVRRKEHFD